MAITLYIVKEMRVRNNLGESCCVSEHTLCEDKGILFVVATDVVGMDVVRTLDPRRTPEHHSILVVAYHIFVAILCKVTTKPAINKQANHMTITQLLWNYMITGVEADLLCTVYYMYMYMYVPLNTLLSGL